jgi:hypothetical protein
MKIIIAGGRDFQDYALLSRSCKHIFQLSPPTEIVSGCASGADSLGEKLANELGIPVTKFFADWTLGKIAGPIRNEHMAKYADGLICFWDGASRGTRNMIKLANKYDLQVAVIRY